MEQVLIDISHHVEDPILLSFCSSMVLIVTALDFTHQGTHIDFSCDSMWPNFTVGDKTV